jgi:hypothetical protein
MRPLSLVAAVFLLACGGGTSGTSISNLTYSPSTATAGADQQYAMTFDFDSQVDITTIEFALVNSPAGPSKTPQDFPIVGATGVHNGTINATLDVTFTTAGTYEFGLDVLDANNNVSNQLTGVITVQ